MRQMTTIYLNDEHIKFFDDNKELTMSHVVRTLLTKYIEKHQQRKVSRDNKQLKSDSDVKPEST